MNLSAKREKTSRRSCAVIGAGVSGIAVAIRLRNKGYDVTVYEANAFPGGKLSSETYNGYRFDMGPSVFTMPEYVDELFHLSRKNPRDFFNYTSLDPVYRYFFEDGSVLEAMHGKEQFASVMAGHGSDSKSDIVRWHS